MDGPGFNTANHSILDSENQEPMESDQVAVSSPACRDLRSFEMARGDGIGSTKNRFLETGVR